MPDTASDKGFCDTQGPFEFAKEEKSNWLSQAVSDAYDYFVPPKNTRPYDIGGFWENQDDLKAHCWKPIELTSEQYQASRDMAEQLNLTGKFDGGSEATKAALQEVLKNGHMEDFVRSVNVNLTRSGSDYRVSSTEFTERMTYNCEGCGPGDPGAIEKNNPRSNLIVTDLMLGGVKDKQVVAYDQKIAGYDAPVPSPRL